ncbi:hypothetical protein [Bacillus salipaludis]|jgi:hypothetical protein|uniref:hypothetical protein n=1 Tax=Bacillus salipaludis TaxID=2547811 RepID=UPI0014047A22|nr:hypothetical protein [Bacillus salipaludis]
MGWMIIWAPLLELIVGSLLYIKFAEKIKDIAFLIVVQIILYVVLMNGLLLYGYLSK